MITLITGTPGGGKSLRAVWYAEQFLREGRAVFGNINGYSRQSPIPGASPMTRDPVSRRWYGGIGGDWRETPDHSVVFYDEAQRDFPQRPNSAAVPEIIRAMEVHRHTGHDIFIITQHPNQVDHWLRRLVTHHDHLRRVGGMGRVALVSADSVMELPVGLESALGEKTFWSYPRHLYDAYDSATFHTVKHRIPQPFVFMSVILVLGLFLGGWAYTRFSSGVKSNSSSVPSVPSSSPSSAPSAPMKEPDPAVSELLAIRPVPVRPILPLHEYVAQVAASRTLMGCARSVNDCRCWNRQGDQLLISAQVCHALLEHGFPTNIRIASGKRGDS